MVLWYFLNRHPLVLVLGFFAMQGHHVSVASLVAMYIALVNW